MNSFLDNPLYTEMEAMGTLKDNRILSNRYINLTTGREFDRPEGWLRAQGLKVNAENELENIEYDLNTTLGVAKYNNAIAIRTLVNKLCEWDLIGSVPKDNKIACQMRNVNKRNEELQKEFEEFMATKQEQKQKIKNKVK